MSYPNFKNKYLEQALFDPKNDVNWKNLSIKNHKKIPKKLILFYDQKILNYFKKRYNPEQIKLYRLLTVYKYKDVGVVCVTGIGAPHATTVLEGLIALGAKEFISIGSAGGLKYFGTFLCEKSIRDEGTSSHYIPHKKFAFPDKGLTKRLAKYLQQNNIPFQKTTSWTIDAIYRETKAEVQKYKKQN